MAQSTDIGQPKAVYFRRNFIESVDIGSEVQYPEYRKAPVRFGSVSDTASSGSNGSFPKSGSSSAGSKKNWHILKLAKNAKPEGPPKQNPETMPIA